MELDALIARLEAAPKDSDELDAHILAYFVGEGAHVERSRFNGAWCVYKGTTRAGEPRLWEPDYRDKVRRKLPWSQSLDAALTLVPAECEYVRFVADPSGSGWELGHYPNGLVSSYRMLGEGCTPGLYALALCIAALKARAALEAPTP